MTIDTLTHSFDPETRRRVLAAAKQEFACNGLIGARLESIAREAETNKRAIYLMFHSREWLFREVVERAYLDFYTHIESLNLAKMPPREGLKKLVRGNWEFYLNDPEFITLVNSENLHQAKHIQESQPLREKSALYIEQISDLLRRGLSQGVFRDGVDPVQLSITMLGIAYYYFTNRYTSGVIYDRALFTSAALQERLRFNEETILRMVEP
ncbi:MAG: TetR family transcriptional regulator [Mangrovicoccus sp.]|nr:TetR family transcriptional regulator [Mangrovicoccus sp.]